MNIPEQPSGPKAVSINNLSQLPQVDLAEKMNMVESDGNSKAATADPLGLGNKYGAGLLLPEGIRPASRQSDAAEVNASLTSSGLLAKHTANIARLAQSFGLNMEGLKEDRAVEQS